MSVSKAIGNDPGNVGENGEICETIWAQSKAMMIPNGINLRAKNAICGAVGRFSLETSKSISFLQKSIDFA